MPNLFSGTGNLGDNPTLKTVSYNGVDNQVAELRVFFDDYKPDGDDGYEPNGGLWLDVSVWGKRAIKVSSSGGRAGCARCLKRWAKDSCRRNGLKMLTA